MAMSKSTEEERESARVSLHELQALLNTEKEKRRQVLQRHACMIFFKRISTTD